MFPSKILIIMTGSIAAAKATLLVSSLVKKGCEIQVVCTSSVFQFIGAATLEGLTGKKVLSALYEEGQMMGHIHLIRWADSIIIAPATANYINKIALGLADDLASTLMLAHQFDKPVFVAPAMNSAMYLHPTTQSALKILREWNFEILEPSSGILACGEEGPGRLLEPEIIQEKLEKYFATNSNIKSQGKKILITAGGTSEPIDGVRVLTNASTGHTGLSLAKEFQKNGYSVTLVHSKNVLDSTPFSKKISFATYNDLKNILQDELSGSIYDAIVHLAAVSDYSVDKILIDGKPQVPSSESKISSDGEMSIHFKKNPKIISSLKSWSLNKKITLIGFKLTQNLDKIQIQQKVEQLLEDSKCDFVVHNDLKDIHKESGIHKYTIYSGPGKILEVGNNLLEMFGSLTKGCHL